MENISSEQLIELQNKGEKILVDFWAEWCGPCKSLIPRLESMEKSYPNVRFVKLNVDQNMDYAISQGITSVPTVMIMEGDVILFRKTGAQSDSVYKEFLDQL